MPSTRAPAALADGGVCRVCGEPFAGPLVRCPTCETPHHQDCWDYNRGCSIYGCSGTAALVVTATADLVIHADAPPATHGRHSVWVSVPGQLALVVVAAAGCLWGLVASLQAVLPLATVLWLLELRRRVREDEDSVEAPTDPRASLDLEMKSIRALVGRGQPAQLAQSYALFEQRHPRESLELEAQLPLARELLAAGYWVLGLEALNKLLSRRTLEGRDQLEELRREVTLRDPAFAAEALGRGTGGLGHERLPTLVAAVRAVVRPPVGDDALVILAASSQGLGAAPTDTVLVPSHPEGPKRCQARWMLGPLDRATALERWVHMRSDAQPVLLGRATDLVLSPTVLDVKSIHLSQQHARFHTTHAQIDCDWRDVRAIVYARMEFAPAAPGIDMVGPGSSRPLRSLGETEADAIRKVDVRPLLEIHVGEPAMRLRIFQPNPELFEYLGRRREYSHAPNMVLVAKDLARFAPGARVSHGLLWMMSEQMGHGLRFPDWDQLEQYILWFWIMGAPTIRGLWRDLKAELGAGEPSEGRGP